MVNVGREDGGSEGRMFWVNLGKLWLLLLLLW